MLRQLFEKLASKNPSDWIDFYQEYGISVLPARERAKSINLPTWDFTAAPTISDIVEWSEQKLFKNICVMVGPPSDFLTVIDIDKPDYISIEFLEELITDDNGNTIGFLVKTGRGYQLWFRNKLEVPIYNEGDPTYKLDLFTMKHIVIAPPSIHPNGSQYAFLKIPPVLKPINVNNIWNRLKLYCFRHDPDVILKPIMNPLVKQKIMDILQDPKCDGALGHNKRLWIVGFLYSTVHLDKQQILDFIEQFHKWDDYNPRKTERMVSSILRHIDNKVSEHGGATC